LRTFAVGDIHGWDERLEALLAQVRERGQAGDSLVFVGDYVDRGPHSRQVVDRVLRERRRWPGPVVTLKGNHEAMMLTALRTWRDSSVAAWEWMRVGDGRATIASYADVISMAAFEAALPADHAEFFERLALWHEDENGIYVHAGIPPGKQPRECSEEELLWIRERFIDSEYQWSKPVIFGHTPQFIGPPDQGLDLAQFRWRPLERPGKIGIDTGCAYGGPLTAVILPEREYVAAR
jgi:serine/threonine protein phosphatase 1